MPGVRGGKEDVPPHGLTSYTQHNPLDKSVVSGVIGNDYQLPNPPYTLSSEPKQRKTHQRRVILEEVRKTRMHLTADEIHARVRRTLPKVSIGTVYRNLEVLAAQGLIHRIEQGHAQRRFDGVIEEHYHLTCTRCGRIEDAPIAPSDNVLDALENAIGLLTKHGIFGHKLEFYGLCERCMRMEPSSSEGESGKEPISNGGQDETA